jgi:predicted RNA-binding protein YlxR (DUF448 family)
LEEKKKPIRMCVACRSTGDKKGLLRLVRGAAGEVSIDPTGKKPGRGAYICRSSECVAAALKKKGFERALRTTVSAELIEEVKLVVQENENGVQ